MSERVAKMLQDRFETKAAAEKAIPMMIEAYRAGVEAQGFRVVGEIGDRIIAEPPSIGIGWIAQVFSATVHHSHEHTWRRAEGGMVCDVCGAVTLPAAEADQ